MDVRKEPPKRTRASGMKSSLSLFGGSGFGIDGRQVLHTNPTNRHFRADAEAAAFVKTMRGPLNRMPRSFATHPIKSPLRGSLSSWAHTRAGRRTSSPPSIPEKPSTPSTPIRGFPKTGIEVTSSSQEIYLLGQKESPFLLFCLMSN
jgi:hypothetical protein